MDPRCANAPFEISANLLTEIERATPARVFRCLLHILAMLRRPRTVEFQWEGIVRELRGVETRGLAHVARGWSGDNALKTLWQQH